jgi:hypothetical protein
MFGLRPIDYPFEEKHGHTLMTPWLLDEQINHFDALGVSVATANGATGANVSDSD